MSAASNALGTGSAFRRIPTEILDQIAEYVGYAYSLLETEEPYAQATHGSMADLCSLSLVTRRFRASAQRLLMRTIYLSDYKGLYHVNYAQVYCLLRTLLDRPDLAQKVKMLKLDVNCDEYLRLADARDTFDLHIRDEFADGLTAHGRLEELDDILAKCADIIHSSSFSSTQKAKWEYDICQPWTGPLCGVVLSLLPNLESLTLIAPARGTVDDHSDPLPLMFGCTFKEDNNVDSFLQSPHSYEQQLGITGRPDLAGLEDVAGLSKLRTLSLVAEPHITVSGLNHLPGIESLDVTVLNRSSHSYRGSVISSLMYTKEDREQFRNTTCIRFAATMPGVSVDADRYLASLAAFVDGIPSLRHLTVYSEPAPYSVHSMVEWITEYQWYDGDRALHAINYPDLLAALKSTSSYLESLTLPTGLWALPSGIPQAPASFAPFARLQYLCVPRHALLGTKAVVLPESFKHWRDFVKCLNEEGWWIDDTGVAHGSIFTKHTNPEVVLQSPVDVLPKTLRHLKVVDADKETCSWLSTLLVDRSRQDFPSLERLEIVLMKEYREEVERISEMMRCKALGTEVVVSVDLQKV